MKYSRFLLKRYQALLWKAHSLLKDSLKAENPDLQAEFIFEHYREMFEELDSVGTQVQDAIQQQYPASQPISDDLEKTYLRHAALLLDAVDRNLKQLKDRALKDVFQNHVGDHIRAFLKHKSN